MDLKQLEYMVAIADCKNISRAADQLFISQSGLNHQLIKLENELGTQLFRRNNHHLELTAAGKIYVENARDILQIKKRTYAQIGDLTNNNTREIGFGLPMEHGIDMFGEVFPIFHERYPGVTFKLQEKLVKEQHEMLMTGKIDVGFVMLGEPDKWKLNYVHLANERLVLGIPRNHPIAQKYGANPGEPFPTIDLALLHDEKFSLMYTGSTMRRVMQPGFDQAGFVPQIMFETSMNNMLCTMVNFGLCCTILPMSQAKKHDNVCWFFMTFDPVWEICMVYNPDFPLTTPVSYFIELGQEYGKKLEKRMEKFY